ncbi:hypothetical protein FRACA_630008 [Frankia canadensis]|uniref:Uncharacterized protein n=1 Tax=Frankia canadensis TaxID=1836972 RepID=A0A2I2KZU4_9ACTN|nr:hypothetical protein FRACA_630008 [Frankia canadensis]SOU58482.1 hypothetical protein FRACA_630008 [Frankia canadensis]
MPGHELLRLGGQRLGLLDEPGRLRLRQQRANPVEHARVGAVAGARPGARPGARRGWARRVASRGTRRRAQGLDRRQAVHHGEQFQRVEQDLPPVAALPLAPAVQPGVVVRPPHAGVEGVELAGPPLVDGGRRVLPHLRGDGVDDEPRVAPAGLAANDPVQVDGLPAARPGTLDRAVEPAAQGPIDDAASDRARRGAEDADDVGQHRVLLVGPGLHPRRDQLVGEPESLPLAALAAKRTRGSPVRPAQAIAPDPAMIFEFTGPSGPTALTGLLAVPLGLGTPLLPDAVRAGLLLRLASLTVPAAHRHLAYVGSTGLPGPSPRSHAGRDGPHRARHDGPRHDHTPGASSPRPRRPAGHASRQLAAGWPLPVILASRSPGSRGRLAVRNGRSCRLRSEGGCRAGMEEVTER